MAMADRRWMWCAVVAMVAMAAVDLVGGPTFDAPVAVAVGPLVASLGLSAGLTAMLAVAATAACFALNAFDDRALSSQSLFRTAVVAALGAIAVLAARARVRRERELDDARSLTRLAELSTSLAATQSSDGAVRAFERFIESTAHIAKVQVALSDDDVVGPSCDLAIVLRAAGVELGTAHVWHRAALDDSAERMVRQACDQLAVALSRGLSADRLVLTARRLRALQALATALNSSLRKDEIALAMAASGRQALWADSSMVYVRHGTDLILTASEGYNGDVLEGFHRIGVESNTPAAQAVRSGRAVIHESRVTADVAYPYIEGRSEVREQAFIALPIGIGTAVAVFYAGFDHPHHFDDDEQSLCQSLVSLAASAWQRAERFELEELQRIEEAARADRSAGLAALTARLAEIHDRGEVARVFAEVAIGAADASRGAVFELGHRRPVLTVLGGHQADSLWADDRPVELTADIPFTIAVISGQSVFEAGAETDDERFGGAAGDVRSLAAIPLKAAGKTIGVVGLAWNGEQAFDPLQRQFLDELGSRVGEALERGRLHENEQSSERRWNLLAAASNVLTTAIEPVAVIGALVRWAVPTIADACTLYIADADGRARAVSVLDVAESDDLLHDLDTDRIDLSSEHPVARVFRAGVTVHLPQLPHSLIEQSVGGDARRRKLLDQLRPRDAVAIPINARGTKLGVMVMVMGSSGRSFSTDDIELIEDLATRFAISYDNAVLYESERTIAARLQKALLPRSLTPPVGMDVTVRYRASNADAGGDWYDLVPLSERAAALVVGDLVGHGVDAAASMSRWRATVRTLARIHREPAAVIGALNAQMMLDEPDETATVLYAVIDLDDRTMTYSSAGHLPPVIVDGASCTVLPVPQGPLIGLGAASYLQLTVPLPAGSSIILYTDGLVERRSESLDVGIRRMCTMLSELRGDDVGTIVDALLAELPDTEHDDDVAIIAARLTATI